jgi:hypothetical protein
MPQMPHINRSSSVFENFAHEILIHYQFHLTVSLEKTLRYSNASLPISVIFKNLHARDKPKPSTRGDKYARGQIANVIKLSIRKLSIWALILEETLLKKGFFQAIFPKLLKILRKGFKGKTLFQKGVPLTLMTLPQEG